MKAEDMNLPMPAESADAPSVWALRRQREDWLAAQGIDQWVPGEAPLRIIQEQVDQGDWHVVRRGHRVVAGLRLLWADPDFWGPDDGTAVYVHGLMVDLEQSGKGMGAELLNWAANLGKRHGRVWLRLDSAATNPGLTAYYENLGFMHQGQQQVGDLFEVNLWQRST